MCWQRIPPNDAVRRGYLRPGEPRLPAVCRRAFRGRTPHPHPAGHVMHPQPPLPRSVAGSAVRCAWHTQWHGETVPLTAALGRVLAADVRAGTDLPGLDKLCNGRLRAARFGRHRRIPVSARAPATGVPAIKRRALMCGGSAGVTIPTREGHNSTGTRVSMDVSTEANRGG